MRKLLGTYPGYPYSGTCNGYSSYIFTCPVIVISFVYLINLVHSYAVYLWSFWNMVYLLQLGYIYCICEG